MVNPFRQIREGPVGWWGLVFMLLSCAGCAGPELRVAAPVVGLEGAVVRHLENPLTGERYTIAGAESPAQPDVTLLTSAGVLEHVPSAGVLDTGLVHEAESTVVSQRARRDDGHLRSIELTIGPLDLASVKLLIPGAGGVVIDADGDLVSQTYPYPGHWSAPMLLIQGQRGGVAVWALDARRPFLGLTVRRTATSLLLDLRTHADPPWPERTRVASPDWHLQAYAGDWPAAAERHRKRMAKHFGLVEMSQREPEWARQTRCVIRVMGKLAQDGRLHPKLRDALRLVASRMPPERVLLYVPNWRTHAYDVMYPDYRPTRDAVVFAHAARAMGFRVMLHGNLLGISPFHPRIDEFEDVIQRDPANGRPVGWYLDRDVPNRIYCLNPAYARARALLVDAYSQARELIEFDALHLDYPVIINTATGRHLGMNTIGGTQVYLRELAQALPGVHFATEGIFDFLLPCGFAQVGEPFWNDSRQFGQYHPIRTAMFWPYCRPYGHLGIPDQQTGLPKYLAFLDVHERTGSLPTFTIHSGAGLDPDAPGTRLALLRAAYWSELQPVPDPELMTADPTPAWMMGGTPLFTWCLDKGRAAGVIQTHQGRQWIEAAGKRRGQVKWGVVHGVNEIESSGHIPEWLAYDAKRLFGLDPLGNYLLDNVARDPSAFHLAWTSEPVVVRAADTDETRDLIRLGPVAETFRDLTKVAADRTGIVNRGEERRLGWGGTFEAASATCGGEPMPALNAHPPWQSGGTDGASLDLAKDALTFGEFRLNLPAEAPTTFVTSIGLRDLSPGTQLPPAGRRLSDGVTFQVLVNDEQCFEEHWAERSWKETRVDLTRWAGTSVTLRLQTHPGPDGHLGWDWASWGQPRIVLADPQAQTVKLRIQQPHRVARTIVTDASSSRILPGSVTETAVCLPATIIYPKKLQAIEANGADLLKVPFVTYTASAGLTQRRSAWGGGRVDHFSIDGVELPGVFGHPPPAGLTRLEWLLDLPPSPLKLRFRAGLLANAEPVTFRVRVNGKLRWTRHFNRSEGWAAGEVDLSEFSDGPVLLTLITDSAGTNNCDWAVWAEPRLLP